MPTPRPKTVKAILSEAAKLAEGVLTPVNRVGEKEGWERAASVCSQIRISRMLLVAGTAIGVA